MQRYQCTIQSINDNVGRMLDFLDDEGLTENTIVVYTTDQGFFLDKHDWFHKRFMDESFQMPFLIRYPSTLRPVVSTMALLQCGLCADIPGPRGLRIPTYMQGVSFRPLLQHKTPADWQQVEYHRCWMHPDVIHEAYAHYGVRDQRYRLIYRYNEDFDLEGTRTRWTGEGLFNSYNDPAYADIVARMTRLLEKMEEIDDDPVHQTSNY
ncbi:alkaline-phosphatase-like protein [Aspergillus navahoensis]